MSEGTLMFGLGATRAGSTWLYRYLADHPDCALPHVKELHYFDALDLDGRDHQIRRMTRIIAQAEQGRDRAQDPTRRAAAEARLHEARTLRDLMKRDEDTEAYLALLRDGRDGRLFGDITPAYALLSETRLRMMAGLARVVKFVYLLRDPVERLWSNIRLAAGQRAARKHPDPDSGQVEAEASALLNKVLDGGDTGVQARSDYAGVLTRLRAAVASENLFIGFYERLFSQDVIDSLCDFLGIRPMQADFARVANQAHCITLAPDHRAALQRQLAPQYDYVEAHFGALPERWSENRVRG